jgi:hypothetical protein
MKEFSSPNEADEGVIGYAEAGVRAMISALHEQKIPPGVMVDVALHILAAWEASRQARSPNVKRVSRNLWGCCHHISIKAVQQVGYRMHRKDDQVQNSAPSASGSPCSLHATISASMTSEYGVSAASPRTMAGSRDV